VSLFRLGEPMPRVEDARLLCGRGAFADDRRIPGGLHAVMVRSPVAHARIRSIDPDPARSLPGVVAVLTGEDWERDGLGPIPCVSIPPSVMGGKWFHTPFPVLQRDRVLCVGHAVAMVVAESLPEALDAAAAISVDYDVLPAAATVAAALATGAPAVWPRCPDNICFVHELGDPARADAALKDAAHVTRARIYNQRLAGNPLEPRVAIGAFDEADARYRLVTSTANPHRIRQLLAEHVFRVPAHRIHVIAGDVGGGFGTKGGLYPEEAAVLWAAQKLGRPVKWASDRSEAFLADFNGRDQLADAQMGFDAAGNILGFRVALYHNLGCQAGPSGAHPPLTGARMLSAVYDIPAIHVRVHGVLTHSRTLTTYRGAGRPEATFLVERMLDQAARELGVDAVELRQRNLIRPDRMPYKTALGETYDSGEFASLLDKARTLADWDGYPSRRQASAAMGLLRGRGLSLYIEVCATVADRMEIRFDPTGGATILAGTFSYGQGHETVYAQMLGDWLGLAPETVRVVQGDTDKVAYGRGSFGSRSMTVGGSALRIATNEIIDRGKRIAAHLLEADVRDLAFERGKFIVTGTDRAIALGEVAKASYAYGNRLPAELASGLEGVGYWTASPQNYPNGCHVIEVEVDPDTGSVRLDRVTAMDDFGVVMNPLLLEGQVHGAIAQGVGQALMERVLHDGAGQLVTGSFMDYAMPRAHDFPSFTLGTRNVATKGNPLGVKGGAETGTVGIPPAVIGAVIDALRPLGVVDLAMPATPERVWQAIQAAQLGGPPARQSNQ
jgi:aerobic carbon-monoxide dehydrogenase large subunit